MSAIAISSYVYTASRVFEHECCDILYSYRVYSLAVQDCLVLSFTIFLSVSNTLLWVFLNAKILQLPELVKQVGTAAWLECRLSHLGVAGSSPGHDNL